MSHVTITDSHSHARAHTHTALGVDHVHTCMRMNTHTHGMLNNLWRLTRIMAVFQGATGADFKDTNINILQSQHIIILVSNTGVAEERMSAWGKTGREKRGRKK